MDCFDNNSNGISKWVAWGCVLLIKSAVEREFKFAAYVNVWIRGIFSSRIWYRSVSTLNLIFYLCQEANMTYVFLWSACEILKTVGNLKGLTDVTGKKGFGSESSSAVPVALRDGFALKVLPSHVILTKLNTDYFSMGQCSPILVSATVPFIISPILHNTYICMK